MSGTSSSSQSSSSSLPSELVTPLADFDKAIKKLSEEAVSPLLSGPSRSDLFETLSPAERAKVDLSCAFALNSLAWILLKTKGADPKETEAAAEVGRVRQAIGRLKEVELRKARHARVDAEAAKRFVRSGLWVPDNKKRRNQVEKGGGERGGKKARKSQ